MKRVKRKVNNNRSSKVDVSDTEEYVDRVDPSSSSFIYDAVDEYHENQEREGAKQLAKLMKRPKSFAQNEVLGVASSSDEEETMKKSKKKKKTKKSLEDAAPIPLDSDMEGENVDNEEEMVGNQEWGKKKDYYNADYVDEDWDNADESEAEVAELEEQEALAIQQRMAQQLEDADFGLDFITHLKEAEKAKAPKVIEEEKIDVNLSKLTKREKLKLLNEESPELMELVDDFKLQMNELKDNLQPILKVISQGLLPHSAGVDYIKTKYNLIMNYCTQIGYYFVLKSKRISVQNHPVIKRLVQFRSLLHQLETAGSKLQPEIDDLLEKIRLGKPLSNEQVASVAPQQPPQKKLRILGKPKVLEPIASEKKKQPTKPKAVSVELTRDEQDAVQFYKAVRQQKDNSESEEGTDEDKPAREEPAAEIQENEEQEIGKRAINYQISKNKGLTPHRSKEQRNPRVKHRMKFRKAQIRRKGAIREPRKELKRYGGEMSGIKATVVRSVKLK